MNRIERARNELRNHLTRQEIEILRAMTAEKRLEVAFGLYRTAWEFKAAWLRRNHPDWTEQQVQSNVREVFLYGES